MSIAVSRQRPLLAPERILIWMLVEQRVAQRLTQEELARKSGVPRSTIARIELEKGNPTLKTLQKIAKALEVVLVVE